MGGLKQWKSIRSTLDGRPKQTIVVGDIKSPQLALFE